MEKKKSTPTRSSSQGRRRTTRTRTSATTRTKRASSGRTGSRGRSAGAKKTNSRTDNKRGPRKRPSGKGHGRRPTTPPKGKARQTTSRPKKNKVAVPKVEKGVVRVIPLGGVEEIGKNMYVVEYGNDIVVIDAGFAFKDEDTPGIDYILPNIQYLQENQDRIRGVLITHGHLDHIGGIPYIMPLIGNPPIYSRNLTNIMIQKKYEEFSHLPPLNFRTIEKNESVTLGDLKIRFFGVTHTIPDSMGIIIETPYGSVVNPGDFKLSHVDGEPTDEEKESYKVFEKENVLFLMADSTNVENPGFSTPEHEVKEGLDKIIKDTKTRLIIGTFASQMDRFIGIIESAEKYNKKIAVEGRSMKTNVEIAKIAGLLKTKPGTIIPSEDIGQYPPDKVVVITTGAQGEEFAGLMRMANKTHKYIKLSERDTVLLSSSVIPGNENSVQRLKDNIARNGTKIIHYRTSEVFIHGSGHGNREEIKWLHQTIKPKFFMPVHGTHYMLRMHGELAEELGMKKENIAIPDNGSIVEVYEDGKNLRVRKEKAPSDIMAVDGFSIGEMQDVVIRDRQLLSEDGIFIVVVALNTRTGKLRKSPDIISRGFIYLRESQDLLSQSRLIVKKTVEKIAQGSKPIDFDYMKSEITDQVRRYLLQQTAKRPVVIPVILGM